ncbi:MAG: hypothetical protein A2945_04195 [Candidatus Liptonbacteria bacterium RIFCSPLOWO2_01_FULL_52_25]|uniref:O-antigen ligase-related domain-containing protein n=1 Tax=Candidatus Liptonbacteria bacterium RIFCSPLOWO2_01_FULL_52_25 TaxID=1798650 RepID=A0A1G2CCB7_9BACT|nr:MAG: hypothetical protein A2945_04195 [Candidatus Liptonbacteria bacterium RIFCSPLOWO2_01_FULL_52_25]
MSSSKLLRVILFLVVATIVLAPLFFIRQGTFPFTISKTAFFQSLVEITFALWIVLAVRDSCYRPSKNSLLFALGAFIGALTVTSLAGADIERSFWSTYERAFGTVAILHCAAFALVVASVYRESLLKKLLSASVMTGTVVAGIAVIQLWVPTLLLNSGTTNRPGSTFDNPTFLAGYVLSNFFFAVYLFLEERRASHGRRMPHLLFFGAAAILNIVAVFITQTRGDILALGAGVFVLILLFAVCPPEGAFARFAGGATQAGGPARIAHAIACLRRQVAGRPGMLQKKAFYRGVAVLLVAGAALFWFTRSNPLWSNVPGLQRFSTISSEDASLQPRLIALRAAWRGFMERPFTGWGWENFNIVFNKHYDPRLLEANYQETRFDKPHNFFMEYLVAGGILLTLGFIALATFFVHEAWRLRDRLWGQFLIAAFAAYVVHGLFVFETIGPALLFYLMIGLVAGARAQEVIPKPHAEHVARVPAWAAGGAILVSLVAAYYFNVRTVQASYYEFLAFNDFVAGRVAAGIEHFKLSIKDWSPYRWNFARDYAAKVVEAYFYQPYLIPEQEVRISIQAMEWVRDEHPEDAFNHYMLVDLYNQASSIDPETYLAAAEREADIALRLSPRRQQVYFSLAKTKFLKGERELALQIVKDMIVLNPRVADGHFYYGLLAFATQDLATGYVEIHEALRLGRKWKNFYEPRTVADYFGDAGHLDEAIELYLTALQMEPGDIETETKLGVAYFLNGDNVRAREYLGAAAKKFDFTKSPAYGQLKPILDTLGIQ